MAKAWRDLPHDRDDWCRNCCQKIYGDLNPRYCGDCLPIDQEIRGIERQIMLLNDERVKLKRRFAYRRRKWQAKNMEML